MSTRASSQIGASHRIALHSGRQLLTAAEVLLKGIFEAPDTVELIAGPARGVFDRVFQLAGSDEVRALMTAHELEAVPTPTAERALAIVARQAQLGRSGVVLVPNADLDRCMPMLAELAEQPTLHGSMLIVLEDAPSVAPASCPRRAVARLGLTCLEAPTLDRMRGMISHGVQISRLIARVVALVSHRQLLHCMDTVEVQPNRVADATDLVLAQARRPRRLQMREGEHALDAARRAQMNRTSCLPNPGEKAKFGFITVGPTCDALEHVTNLFNLRHRIPLLRLELLNPLDEVTVGRFLLRCDHVIVLEPRRSSMEPRILEVAERLRHAGEQPALVWGESLPGAAEQHDDRNDGQTNDAKTGAEDQRASEADLNLHPSVLVRRLQHLLEEVRPGTNIQAALAHTAAHTASIPVPRPQSLGDKAAEQVIGDVLNEVEQMLQTAPLLEDEQRTVLIRDCLPDMQQDARQVSVEQWSLRRFLHDGLAAISVAAREGRPALLLVLALDDDQVHDVERLARAATPGSFAERVQVHVANLTHLDAMRQLLLESVKNEHINVIIIEDGPPARFDFEMINRELQETDRLGFQQRQRMVWPASEACRLRRDAGSEEYEKLLRRTHFPVTSDFMVEQLSKRLNVVWRLRIRVLNMEVEVRRSRPPAISDAMLRSVRPRLPQPIHARAPVWRAHLAGYRGNGAGVVGTILCEAGRRMGYHVRSVFEPIPASPGLHSWCEVVFTHNASDTESTVAARTPFGEADVLLGLHADETLRAVHPGETLRVAARDRTAFVVNTGEFHGPFGADVPKVGKDILRTALEQFMHPDHSDCRDFAETARRSFHTDRLTDVLMLGHAYQRGLIPVQLQAINDAMYAVERAGYSRLLEAFELGRRIAELGSAIEPRSRTDDDPKHEARRYALMLRQHLWRGNPRAAWYRKLVQRMLQAMPGLAESDAGRQSQVDFVRSIYRCYIWGGAAYAERYADTILRLYENDRGDTGRLLTRESILPLADVMLLHDPLYVAAMCMSAEERSRVRKLMNIKLARDDVVERRFLSRIEMILLRTRIRFDVRSSNWLVQILASSRHAVMQRWRGTKRKRSVRDVVTQFTHRAITRTNDEYDEIVRVFRLLRAHAESGTLQTITLAKLEDILEVHSEYGSSIRKPNESDADQDE